MKDKKIMYKKNPSVILREEFDDWGVLFDTEKGEGFCINPMGIFIWKQFDGNTTITTILNDIQKEFRDTPEDLQDHVQLLMNELQDHKLIHSI